MIGKGFSDLVDIVNDEYKYMSDNTSENNNMVRLAYINRINEKLDEGMTVLESNTVIKIMILPILLRLAPPIVLVEIDMLIDHVEKENCGYILDLLLGMFNKD